jgi:hypothetical protein
LRLFANEHRIRIAAIYIKDPRYTIYHELGEAQFRALATNKGSQQGPTYDSVGAGQSDAFTQRTRDVVKAFVEIINQAKAGQMPTPLSLQAGVKKTEPASPMRKLAVDMGYAALVEWIGRQTHAKAPRDIIAWAVDQDLLDPTINSMEVRVLLNKRQLDSLSKLLQDLITAARRGRMTGEDFFTALQATVAVATRDPDQIRNATYLAGSGLVPDFLRDLPYKSALMEMSNDMWASWADAKQDVRLREWESKIKLYTAFHDTPGNWILLNKEDDADEAVYAIPIDALP